MKIFVLADTHNKLPQQVVDLARDADEIWHLGDVCEPTITLDLETIGPPLTVVRGNCDWNTDWPLVVDLTRERLKFRLVHIPPEVMSLKVVVAPTQTEVVPVINPIILFCSTDILLPE